MSENKIDVDLMISEKKFDLSLSTIFIDSLKMLKKTILPTLIFIFLLSLIIAGLNLLILTGAKRTVIEMSASYADIVEILNSNPEYVLSDEMNKVYRNYPILFLIINIAQWSMPFFILICLLMISTGKIYSLYYDGDVDSSSGWIKSVTIPFNSGKRAMTSLFLLIFGSILISIGFLIFIFPGILILYYGIFSIHSLIIDEKEGKETIRGGFFYVKGLFSKLIFILLISIFIPMLIQNYTLGPLMNLFGLTNENYILWIDSTSPNYGMIYIYNFMDLFLQNILFFFVPVIYTVSFVQIREGKLDNLSFKLRDGKESKDNSRNIITIEIEKNQNQFKCPNCDKKLPISAKKCYKCKQLFNIKFK
jgi:predicted RNA-binding Zn-ribbon protein involved in translation (DUF1610 family)